MTTDKYRKKVKDEQKAAMEVANTKVKSTKKTFSKAVSAIKAEVK